MIRLAQRKFQGVWLSGNAQVEYGPGWTNKIRRATERKRNRAVYPPRVNAAARTPANNKQSNEDKVKQHTVAFG